MVLAFKLEKLPIRNIYAENNLETKKKEQYGIAGTSNGKYE